MKRIALLICIAALAVACKTYTVEPGLFKQQFAASGSTMQETTINNPLLRRQTITYKANNLKGITVTDKHGDTIYLENSPSIEMRVTQKNGKRKIMYFDTVELRNDTLYGGASRFLGGIVRKIPFDSITKIEIQDGGKKYHYQN
jgi:hypothetical protein